MRSVAIFLGSLILLSSTGCSIFSKGFGFGDGDGMDGNIPTASVGGELSDINFTYDSSALSPRAQEKLRRNAEWLKSNESQRVIIEGHCDERGTAEYNLALGEKRAQAVQSYLQSLGVSSRQLSTVTYGEELPLDPTPGETAYSRNRRVHFALRK